MLQTGNGHGILAAMDESAFWQMIAECRPADPDPDAIELAEALTARLIAGPLYQVKGFAEQLSWALYRLDRRELGQELSGDAFLYTRAAVVAAGRETFESVLADPSEFAAFANGYVWAESLLYGSVVNL
jgi:hypothetical protein